MRLVVVYAVHEDATVGSGSQAAGRGDATEKEMATARHTTGPFGALSYETLVRQVAQSWGQKVPLGHFRGRRENLEVTHVRAGKHGEHEQKFADWSVQATPPIHRQGFTPQGWLCYVLPTSRPAASGARLLGFG